MDSSKHQLKILNSFSRKKDLFSPIQAKTIKWYSCGPTVYDASHLGHARCYITFDIIRRILTNYFGYKVIYCMNITDIDDKIIKKARSNYLCDRYIENIITNGIKPQVLINELKLALENYKTKRNGETDQAKVEMFTRTINSSNETLCELEKEVPEDKTRLAKLIETLRDIIADNQDDKYGDTISDHKIFKALTLSQEREFHEDMRKLDVIPPTVLTRVSEYIDEIGKFIKKIEANGYAYRSGGSIYFDTLKFDASPKHTYAKLVREAYGEKKSLDEGEGELSTSESKRSLNDFALWKKSKKGEPQWQTEDFEPGRPGWHIECSVMASRVLGENFDIHSGGCDLKFPHHDNEIAQSEAFYDTGKSWVNYFIHSGHLTISGCKMSKSLKNFITIRQALEHYTSRQIRFAFLAHGWAETLDYSPNTMSTAMSYEKTFSGFLYNIADMIRHKQSKTDTHGVDISGLYQKWASSDFALNDEFLKAIDNVDSALCDNFDTRTALNVLCGLVKECNKRHETNLLLLIDIANFIRHLLHTFGTNFEEIESGDKLFASNVESRSSVEGSGTTLKLVDAVARFRADIRHATKTDEPQTSVQRVLSLCDDLRDKILPELGIRLEDKEFEGAPYVIKIVGAEAIAQERALAEKREQEKNILDQANKLEKLKLQQQREDKMRLSPAEMFKMQTEKYSRFDDEGMPTHDAAGKEISKSALKKLQRLYAEQKARYEKYISTKA